MSVSDKTGATPSGVARMVVVLSLLFAAGQFHRASGSVVAPELVRDLGLGPGDLGAMAASLFFVAALAQVPIGLWLDRYGPRRTMASLLGFGLVGTLLFATAHSVPVLILSRVLIGFGFASVMMSAFVVYSRWVTPDRFATVVSWTVALGGVGAVSATLPLAWAVETVGWRTTFLGLAAVVAALWVSGWLTVRDAPPSYQPTAGPPQGLAENLAGLWQVVRHRRFHFILGMWVVAYAPPMTILGLWGGPYLRDVHGLDGVERGYALLAMAVAGLVGMIAFGPLDRIFGTRKWVVLPAATSVAVALGVLGLWPRPSLGWAILLFVAINFLQQYYVVLSAHCRATFPDHLVGRASTTLNLVAITGVAVMQQLVSLVIGWFEPVAGVVPEHAYRTGFLAMAVCVAAAVLLYLRSTDARPAGRG